MSAKELAGQLLDAQVEFVLSELSGKRLAQVIARDVDDLLELGEHITVADALDPELAKRVLRNVVDNAGGSPLLEEIVTNLSDAIYDLPASDNYRLDEVVDRDPVEALIVKLLSMDRLHDRALNRMAESPLVGTVASRFVGKIVADFLQQNRQMAERLPGAKSLISFGMGAASKVRSATVDQFLGDAVGKGTKYAIKQTNNAMRDLVKEAPLRGAAMEIWDLQAGEPVSDLREFLTKQDLRDVVLIVHELVRRARSTEYIGELLDQCVDVLFAEYGSRSLASLLADLGVERDALVADLREGLPKLIDAAKADGRLEALVRGWLKPFYASKKVLGILA